MRESAVYSRSSLFLLHGVLNTFHDRPLPLRTNLLGALERNKGELEVMGSLLQ